MLSIDELKFDEKGLIPAVVVDSITKKVLTVAYMNRESLQVSMEKGLTCFWSRSRQELWLKGETSGNYQHIVSITADCDGDALVVMVEKDGPACHTGADSCFMNPVWENESLQEFSLQGLYDMLVGRNENRPSGYQNHRIAASAAKPTAGTMTEILKIPCVTSGSKAVAVV